MGIIGAMDVEIALLREEMAKAGAVKITRIAGMEFNVGTIGNATVIVVQCGVAWSMPPRARRCSSIASA